MKKRTIITIMLFCFTAHSYAKKFDFYPNADYNSSIPTLEQVVGHSWGEKITSHGEVERYIKALAEASPNVKLIEYGKTWEARALYYLVVASEKNMARLDEIKDGMQKLADPRIINTDAADNLIESLPSVVWLAYGVHGNEISSTDAGLLTAYHLVASKNDTVAKSVLANTVVIIDPMQNPDGRDRFVNYFRQTRGRWPNADQKAAEHNEDWPGGRTNHYLFDMNRDWFALTQPETRGRVQAYLEWYPQVFVDLHEMGSNSTYYFAPPADPLNPEMPPEQLKWLERFGRNNARWFDRMHFDYFTREVFDSFYPGYGEGWPMFQGSIGMTYEQASARGLVVKREDETTMHYRDTVQHHFISSLATAETAATHRESLLRYFYKYRQSAIQEGLRESIKEYIIPPGSDPNRSAKLASLLLAQGIEVKKAEIAFTNSKVKDYYGGQTQSKRFPEGTFVVSLAQPAKRLAKTLLAKQTSMDDAFIKEQLRRQKKRLGDQIYDVTGWSLPLIYDIDVYRAEGASKGHFSVLSEAVTNKNQMCGDKAKLAYLIPWGSNSSAAALLSLFHQNIRVFSSDKTMTLNGKKFPRGSLIIKVKNNPQDLHQRLEKLASETGAEIIATHTSWMDAGVSFGSGNVNFLKKPEIAMAYHIPTSSYSVGWARYILEQQYSYPVTIMNTSQLGCFDLSKYNVLILPNTRRGYTGTLGESGAKKIKAWVQNGGTLITFGQATHWLTEDKVDLLATSREFKGGKSEKKKKEEEPKQKEKKTTPDLSQPFNVEKEIQPDEELPASTPGAIMRVKLDTEHWLAFGYDGDANVMVSSRNIYTPIKLDKGRNIGLYMPEDKVVVSGFTWEDARKQIANKAYLMHQRHGRGHVVAFAEDPNYRAFMDGLNLLFLNAVCFGPAH